MKPKYQKIIKELEDIVAKMSSSPSSDTLKKMGKRQSQLNPIANNIKKLLALEDDLNTAKELDLESETTTLQQAKDRLEMEID